MLEKNNGRISPHDEKFNDFSKLSDKDDLWEIISDNAIGVDTNSGCLVISVVALIILLLTLILI